MGILGRVAIDKFLSIVENKKTVGNFKEDLIIEKGHKGAFWTGAPVYC